MANGKVEKYVHIEIYLVSLTNTDLTNYLGTLTCIMRFFLGFFSSLIDYISDIKSLN